MPSSRVRSRSPGNEPPARRSRAWELLLAFATGALLVAIAFRVAERGRSGTAAAPPASAPAAAATPPPSKPGFDGKPGPWGVLEYTPIAIAPPRELVKVDGEITPTRWSFPGYSRSRAEELLRSLGMSAAELADLADSGWKATSRGVTVVPSAALILGLRPEVRSAVYTVLAHHPENVHNAALALDPEDLERRLATSGLAPATVQLLRRLLYRRDDVLFFADDRTLLPLLASPEERLRLVLMLARRQTFAVRLKIDPQSDVRALVQYWGGPGRAKDIEPILSSLAGLPGGYALDLAHLLPGIPRRRVYTYPRPGVPGDESKNCHWTSFNFHADVADDRFADVNVAREEVARRYRPVSEPAFGDLVLLVDQETGAVVHSASYLADDLVFTKNGFGFSEPWLYMELAAMRDLYGLLLGKRGSLEILLYRRRSSRS